MSLFVLIYSYASTVLAVAGTVKHTFFRSYLVVLALLPIVVLPAFRAESVGRDTIQYHHIFNLVVQNPDHHYIQSGIEPLFRYLIVFLNTLGCDANSLIALAAILFFFATWRLIRSCSPSYSLSIVVLLSIGPFFFMFSGLRQSIAIAIVLFSFGFLQQRRLSPFVASIFLAIGFHLSAIIFLVTYFLKKNIALVFLGVAAWVVSLVFALIPGFIVKLVALGAVLVPAKYMALLEGGELIDVKNISVRFAFSQVLFLSIAITCFRRNFFEYAWLPSLISMIGIIMGNVFLHAVALGRLTWYFEMFHVLTIPLIVRYWFGGLNYVVVSMGLMALFFIFFLRQMITDVYVIFPYSVNSLWW